MTPKLKPLFHLTAEDLMNPVVITVSGQMSLTGAAHLLSQNHISGAPVVDDAGRCIGVVSATDFLSLAGSGKASLTSAAEHPCYCSDWAVLNGAANGEDRPANVESAMTGNPVTAHRTALIGELARNMIDTHVHRVIIVDDEDHPVGVVASTDVLAALAHADAEAAFGPSHYAESDLVLIDL